MNNLQKTTYHVNDNIDLHDVFSVVYVPEGTKRKRTRNMLVREFIEFLQRYPQDAELSYNVSYYGDNAEIWDRIETDEEYEARIKELQRREKVDKLRKQVDKLRKQERKKKKEEQEKETLLKLAAKYKIKIDKEI